MIESGKTRRRLFPQSIIACGGTLLQGRTTELGLAEDLFRQLPGRGDRELGIVGEARRQRNEIGGLQCLAH